MPPIRRLLAAAVAATAGIGTLVVVAHSVKVAAGETLEIQIAGANGVPANVTAATFNLTAVNAGSPGYATAYPCGTDVPGTSTLNYSSPRPVANSSTTRLGADGKLCIYTLTPTDLIVDLQGYYTDDESYVARTPERFVDTRVTASATADRGVLEVPIAGVRGVPANATAVTFNLTSVNGTAPGYATAYPCGSAVPPTSTLNYSGPLPVANSSTTKLGTGGKLCIYTLTATDLIVDVQGYHTDAKSYAAITPNRVMDTRTTRTPVAARSIAEVSVADAGVPANADAVTFNLTTVNGAAPGYATAFPCGSPLPNASNVNYGASLPVANSGTTKLGDDGKLCIYALTRTDVIVDVQGYHTAADSYTPTTPLRLADTRPSPPPGPSVTPPAPTPTLPPTPPAPSGGQIPPVTGPTQFIETFESDARERFEWQLQSTNEPPQRDFVGEHNMGCEGPATHRTVHQIPLEPGRWHTRVDATHSEMVWFCAPGNDTAKGHMMTALDTDSIASLNFSPKQVFVNVTKVCWDQNMNNLGEGKWLNVFIVPNPAFTGDLAFLAGSGESFGGIEQRMPAGAVDFTWLRGSMMSHQAQSNGTYQRQFDQWMSIDPVDNNGDGIIDRNDAPTQGVATDPAPRFTICVDDGNDQVLIERPNGTVDAYPYNVQFPTGPVRVIFQDASYNPTKHNGFESHLTWHWDNIVVV